MMVGLSSWLIPTLHHLTLPPARTMLLPLSSDAPLYHYPLATVGMIIVNLVCFLIFGPADPESMWMLHYGTINPAEWVLSSFMHSGWGHLIGNMFFLWAYGLIVEGKLGWKSFIAVYLMIGTAQCAIEQTMMLHRTEASALAEVGVESREELVELFLIEWDLGREQAERDASRFLALERGASCGASSVIFGLLAICLVWAPKNEFDVILFFFFRPITFEITIIWYSVFYLCYETLSFWIDGFRLGSSALHAMGAGAGFGIGVLYLKKDWVNCENWDLFKVLSGKYGPYADASTTVGNHADPTLMFGKEVAVTDSLPRSEEKKVRTSKSNSLKKIHQLIDSNSIMEASEEMYALQMRETDTQLDQKHLKRFCQGLVNAAMPDDAELFLDEYIERFPDDAAWARVRSAEILLNNQRPAAAIRTLKQVRLSQLTSEYQTLAKRTVKTAKQQVADGIEDAAPEW